MKKIVSVVFSFCLCAVSMFGVTQHIHASTLIQVGPFIGDIHANVHTASGDVEAAVPYLSVEGKLVYCVQPLKSVYDGNEVIPGGTSLTEAQKKKIAYISSSGYNESDRHSDKWYAATQLYIWEAMGYSFTVNGFDDYKTYRDDIAFRTEHFETLPSFTNQKVTLKKGVPTTLVDTSSVFSLYKEVHHKGAVNMTRQGNNLILKSASNKQEEGSISFQKVADSEVGLSIVYQGATDNSVQETIRPMVPANILGSLTYRVQPYGNVSFLKKGEVVSSVIKEETPYGTVHHIQYEQGNLTGVKANLYAREDIKDVWGNVVYQKDALVEEMVSQNTSFKSKDIPAGKYYVKEISTIDGYVLDETEYDVEIHSDSEVFDIQNVTLHNVRSKVHLEIQKVMEESRYMDLAEAYKDVVMGIYAKEDIVSFAGEVLVPKGELVVVSGIDEKGHLIETVDLPLGEYYLQELATNSHYVLDDTPYDFTVSPTGEEVISIVVGNGVIENKLHRNTLTIRKVDKESEKPLSATFALYDQNKEEIMQFTTDEKGEYVFDALPDGTFFVKELEAPKGYVLDEAWHKITVEKDVVYTIENQKIVTNPSIDTKDVASHAPFEWSMLMSMGVMYFYLAKRFV